MYKYFDELKKNQIQLESASGILKSNLNENFCYLGKTNNKKI